MVRSWQLAGNRYFELQLEDRKQVVPEWMTDPERMARLTYGLDPICSLESLLELAQLLASQPLSTDSA